MTLIPMTEPRSSANTDDVITVIGINTDDEETMAPAVVSSGHPVVYAKYMIFFVLTVTS